MSDAKITPSEEEDLIALDDLLEGATPDKWSLFEKGGGVIYSPNGYPIARANARDAAAIVALRNSYPILRRIIERQAVELAEWRRLASDEVYGTIDANVKILKALEEAQAEIERLKSNLNK